MRRAERLFQIIQILRGARGPVTGRDLAEELETSLRTLYRDIAELLAQRIPIRGEAGVGYVLDQGYDMPPLMLTPDEIEAAVLGAQWVAGRGDPALRRGARDLVAKIGAVVPAHLRPMILESALNAPSMSPSKPDALDMAQVRAWIRTRGKLRIRYSDEAGRESARVLWPIAVAYFDSVRLIVAWCELRQGFRHFRTDRIKEAEFLDETFPTPVRTLRAAWKKEQKAVCGD
jgi:predicted DNA-binding transcriptional regulator YafY